MTKKKRPFYKILAHGLRDSVRGLRASAYHFRHGRGFRFQGYPVHVPRWADWGIKQQLMQGVYESAERELLDEFFQPGLPVVELGGSIGVLSSYVARRLEAGTPYVIVEADAKLVPICRRNVAEANPSVKAEVVNAAIAYGADRVFFFTSENFHVGRVSAVDNPSNTSVKAISLANLLETRHITGDYLAIIDIEGAEYAVFENDSAALRQARVIIVETHPHVFDENGQTLEGFLDMARKAGFSVKRQVATSYALVRDETV